MIKSKIAKESVNNFVSKSFQKDFGSKQNQFEAGDFKPLFVRKIFRTCGKKKLGPQISNSKIIRKV
jgi:hypothetical protein